MQLPPMDDVRDPHRDRPVAGRLAVAAVATAPKSLLNMAPTVSIEGDLDTWLQNSEAEALLRKADQKKLGGRTIAVEPRKEWLEEGPQKKRSGKNVLPELKNVQLNYATTHCANVRLSK